VQHLLMGKLGRDLGREISRLQAEKKPEFRGECSVQKPRGSHGRGGELSERMGEGI